VCQEELYISDVKVDFAQKLPLHQVTTVLWQNTSSYIISSGQYVSIPGWNQLCIGINLNTSAVGSSINGQISQKVTTVSGISDKVTKLLSTSTITLYVEMFTQFKIYSLPVNQVVPGSSADLLDWNIADWDWDPLAREVTTFTKADINSLGGTRYLAIPSKFNFRDAVSGWLISHTFLQFISILS
jgi:hypothetical protein